MAVHRDRSVGAGQTGQFINIDYSAVSLVQQAFRDLPLATKRNMRAAMAEAATEFRDVWRGNLAYSKWQPAAVDVPSTSTISTRGLFTVRLDSSKAPAGHEEEPRLQEFGVPFWRHPVFGNREVWRSQKGHPAMVPAVKESGSAVRTKASAALLEAARSVGLV